MSLFDQFSWDGTRSFPYWWSAYWLGPTAIPPVTMNIALTDRDASATIWYMFLEADNKHIRFTTTKPAGPVKVFGPYDGPFVGQFQLRMGIKSGHVVVDAYPEQGAGPFCRGISSSLQAAVLFGLQKTGQGNFVVDHLAFQSDKVQGGIFDPTP